MDWKERRLFRFMQSLKILCCINRGRVATFLLIGSSHDKTEKTNRICLNRGIESGLIGLKETKDLSCCWITFKGREYLKKNSARYYAYYANKPDNNKSASSSPSTETLI